MVFILVSVCSYLTPLLYTYLKKIPCLYADDEADISFGVVVISFSFIVPIVVKGSIFEFF